MGIFFQISSKLQIISFYDNSIQKVEANLLSNLNELKRVDFRYNHCINVLAATPEAIESLKIELITQCQTVETSTINISSTTIDSDQCLPRCTNSEVAPRQDMTSLEEEQFQRVRRLENIVRELESEILDPCTCSL